MNPFCLEKLDKRSLQGLLVLERSLGAENTAMVFVQGIKPDVFLWELCSVVSIELASAFGFAHMCPVGRFVRGSFEARSLHKGLDQDWSIVVAFMPIVSDSSAGHA